MDLANMMVDPIDKSVIMNCNPVPHMDALKGGPDKYLVEPKFDGFRLIIRRNEMGEVDIFTRNGKSQNGKLPWLEELMLHLPYGTIIDGEIAAPYWDAKKKIYVQDFEQVQSIMLSKPERAVTQAAKTRDLTFYGFDVLALDCDDLRDLPFFARRQELQEAYGKYLKGKNQLFQLAQLYRADHQAVHDKLCQQGFEGTVAKHMDSQYLSGKRGHGWFKLKKQDTVDVIVLGYKPGTKALEGMVGGVVFGQLLESAYDKEDHAANVDDDLIVEVPGHEGVYAVIRGSCSGFDLAERRHLTDHWDEYVGKVMEIGHMGAMVGGIKLRHPQFKRWRLEKDATECHWHNE